MPYSGILWFDAIRHAPKMNMAPSRKDPRETLANRGDGKRLSIFSLLLFLFFALRISDRPQMPL